MSIGCESQTCTDMYVKHKLTLPDTLTLPLHADRNTGQQPAGNLPHYDRVPVGNQPVVMGIEWMRNTSLPHLVGHEQSMPARRYVSAAFLGD